MVRAASTDELDRTVAPTPAWRVRDVLAHVVGITADMNALDFDVEDPEAWTARQVERRRGHTIEAIVEEWDREAQTFEEGLRQFGYELGAHYVGDLYTHLQDVRTTLGVGIERDPVTVLVALDFYLDALDEVLRAERAGAVEVVAGDEHHVAGGDEPVASVRGDAFEILRCLSGRRSLDQIRALDWTGDVERMAPLLSRYPLPDQPFVG